MVNSLICDKVTSLTAAEAIVAALFSAERTGQGQRVEISMLDAALSFLWPDTMNNFTFLDDGIEPVAPLDHSSLFARNQGRLDCQHACSGSGIFWHIQVFGDARTGA